MGYISFVACAQISNLFSRRQGVGRHSAPPGLSCNDVVPIWTLLGRYSEPSLCSTCRILSNIPPLGPKGTILKTIVRQSRLEFGIPASWYNDVALHGAVTIPKRQHCESRSTESARGWPVHRRRLCRNTCMGMGLHTGYNSRYTCHALREHHASLDPGSW